MHPFGNLVLVFELVGILCLLHAWYWQVWLRYLLQNEFVKLQQQQVHRSSFPQVVLNVGASAEVCVLQLFQLKVMVFDFLATVQFVTFASSDYGEFSLQDRLAQAEC